MKKRLLIICSILGVLLAGFQFPIYAEETTPDYSSSTSIITSAALDQYFYDNYELLPYIESDGSQYIDSGIISTSNLKINCKFTGLVPNRETFNAIYGTYKDYQFYLRYYYHDNTYMFSFGNTTSNADYSISYFDFLDVIQDRNKCYINGTLVKTFNDTEFSDSESIYIFAIDRDGAIQTSKFKLYGFSIYDYAAANGEGALVRDYYPARSKSGGIIGLYDAITKTFVTTSGSVPFASPTGDPVNLSLGANITQFLSGSLSWIGAIFEGINEMPIIWVFIAIALAGVMFRWARRIVHF